MRSRWLWSAQPAIPAPSDTATPGSMSREWVDSGDQAAFDQSLGVVVENPDLANEVVPGKRENEEVAARFMYLDPRDPINSYYHFKYARMSGSRAAARTVDELNKQLASSVPYYVPSTVRLVIGALVLLAGFFLCILHDKKISQLLTGVALLVAGPIWFASTHFFFVYCEKKAAEIVARLKDPASGRFVTSSVEILHINPTTNKGTLLTRRFLLLLTESPGGAERAAALPQRKSDGPLRVSVNNPVASAARASKARGAAPQAGPAIL